MSELKWRAELRKKLNSFSPNFQVEPVENSAFPGMPDLMYSFNLPLNFASPSNENGYGWIELKIGQLPIDQEDLVKVHFASQQRNWIKKHSSLGGRVWVFVKVNNYLFMFLGRDVGLIGKQNMRQMTNSSYAVFDTVVDAAKMVEFLIKGGQ